MIHTNDKLENILRNSDLRVKYDEFDSDKPYIVAKVDWFSGIFEQTTVKQVFDYFGVDTAGNYEDFLDSINNRIINVIGALWTSVIRFKGIMVSFSNNELFSYHCSPEEIDSIKLQNIVFNNINVTISGSGLDELRSYGIDIDRKIYDLHSVDREFYHITRIDFAFDFINVGFIRDTNLVVHDLFDDFYSTCQECRTLTGRITTGGTQGLGYSVRLGDQRTIYLGSPRSDRLLRVYDKKLQFEQKAIATCPYRVKGELPISWIRIELQCRRNVAHALAYPTNFDNTYLHVLRFIYDKCMPRKRTENGCYITAKWINQLFDWDKLPSYLTPQLNKILNIGNMNRAREFFSRNLKQSILMYAKYGKDRLFEATNNAFIDMQMSNNKKDICRTLNIKAYISDVTEDLPYLNKGEDGIYSLKDD